MSLITEPNLARLAGDRSFARGVAYFKNGAVLDLVQTASAIRARVLGSEEYRVALRTAGRELECSCSCPLGAEGVFCKHAVASGLAWLERRGANRGSSAASGGDELERIRSYLQNQSKEALAERLLEQAADDPELRARLQAEALHGYPPSGLNALKETVRRAFAVPRGFVDWRGMRVLVTRADSVVLLLRDLLTKSSAADVLVLADYAMRRAIVAYQKCDDSGGAFGDTLRQIADLHLEICRAAKSEGEALAAQLFELQMLDEWGLFEFESYAPLLGERGLARYRALAENAWAAVPALSPGDAQQPGTGRVLITDIMERLARHDGDVDAFVAVKRRDLSHTHAFLEIAVALGRAGRDDEALAWAERGWKSFPDEFNVPLVEFLLNAYARQKRHDEAGDTAWHHFSRYPGISSYRLLRESAKGTGAWESWRDKALAHVRSGLKTAGRPPGRWHWTAGGRSLLVEIFLDEGDTEAALAEAKAGGCTEDLWMELAKARAGTHPQDAVAIYQARIDPIVARTNSGAYDEAAELVGAIKKLMARMGKEKDFGKWLAELRTKHKAKRNFMHRLQKLY